MHILTTVPQRTITYDIYGDVGFTCNKYGSQNKGQLDPDVYTRSQLKKSIFELMCRCIKCRDICTSLLNRAYQVGR